TPHIADQAATVVVEIDVENDTSRRTTVEVLTEITNPDGVVVARDRQPVTVARLATATARARLIVPEPRRWSPDTPDLYVVTARLTRDGVEADATSTTFGIRSLSVDAERGLRINDESVNLRGA